MKRTFISKIYSKIEHKIFAKEKFTTNNVIYFLQKRYNLKVTKNTTLKEKKVKEVPNY